jgi:hypothetical protein
MRANSLIFFVVSVVFGLAFGQVPEFVQQYSQRLGGAVDELGRIVQHFDDDSRLSGYDRVSALRLMASDTVRLVRDQATRMEENIARLDRLREQQAALTTGGSFKRVGNFVMNVDRALAASTIEEYAPALPMTIDGLLFAIGGFIVGWAMCVAGAMVFQRRRSEAHA